MREKAENTTKNDIIRFHELKIVGMNIRDKCD